MIEMDKYLGNEENPYLYCASAGRTSKIKEETKIIGYGAFYNGYLMETMSLPENIITINLIPTSF